MKQLIILIAALVFTGSYAQTNDQLKKHFEAYYTTMKNQGDVQGVINAITHLNVLEPNTARQDTLAYLYLSEGNYMQALNTIGVEKNESDSDINVEVKALALKNLNQPKMALEHFDVLFKRKPTPFLAYEMADMEIQTNNLEGAKAHIEYGMANVKDDMKRAFYETQQPYETSLKAAFTYLNGLLIYRQDPKANIDKALKEMNAALDIDPNFNLAKVSRQALEGQKAQQAAAAKNN